jgi:hypothetical protein
MTDGRTVGCPPCSKMIHSSVIVGNVDRDCLDCLPILGKEDRDCRLSALAGKAAVSYMVGNI